MTQTLRNVSVVDTMGTRKDKVAQQVDSHATSVRSVDTLLLHAAQRPTDEVTEMSQSAGGKTYFLGSIKNQPGEAWYEPLQLNGKTAHFKIDTGADVTEVSSATWDTLGRPAIRTTNMQLNSPGGKLRCLGEFTVQAKCKG